MVGSAAPPNNYCTLADEITWQYFSEWERAGVTRMWLRNSDLSSSYPKPNDNCEWNPILGTAAFKFLKY